VNGARVGITADRRAREQAALVRVMGGVPVLGPSLLADAPAPDARVGAQIDAALGAPLAAAVFLTGAGVELTLAAAARTGRETALRAALAPARVLARGPKPRRALRAAGVRLDWVADPPRWQRARDELLRMPLAGARVLVQGFGPPPDELAGPLRDAGAEVVVLSPYAAGWPPDPGPAQALAREAAAGSLGALTFTSAQAARQFVVLAEAAGVDPPDLTAAGTLVAAVGPVTREALEGEGVAVAVEPDAPKMGALYHAVAGALRSVPSHMPEARNSGSTVHVPSAGPDLA
jgi:uroporphyrinogen-III synthase